MIAEGLMMSTANTIASTITTDVVAAIHMTCFHRVHVYHSRNI